MTRTARLLGTAIALGFPQHGLADTETIVVSGDPAGGVPGAVFDSFSDVRLNDSGEVAYRAFLETGVGGVDFDNDRGVWRDNTLIMREGSPAGGTPAGVDYDGITSAGPAFNNTGQVGYIGFLRTGTGGVDSTNNSGVWLDDALIARAGSQAPGTPAGAVFSFFFELQLNNAGQILYQGSLQTGTAGIDSTNSEGIWLDNTLVARGGDPAGGTHPDAVFSFFVRPQLNDAGQVAFEAFLSRGVGGVDSDNDNGIWRDDTLIAREGDSAGGTPAGAVFSHFTNPRINNAGQVAYHATLRSGVGGVDSNNDSGLWLDSTLIAREGSQAGGTPDGAVFDRFFFVDYQLNDAGQVAYRANLRAGTGGVDTSNDQGLWRDTTLIAREGGQAPGTPAGALFGFINDFRLNDGGQVAHHTLLRSGGGGVNLNNNEGIWITGPNGQSLLVVREGNALAGGTVGGFGALSSLNRFSQVAYSAGFAGGGNGIFLYTPDLRWTHTASGDWDTADHWTIGQLPGDPHDVSIDSDTTLTVTGPAGDVTLTRLQVGGGTGTATLALNGGSIAATDSVVVVANGVLGGTGTIDGHLDAQAGAIIAPGQSAGRITATDFTLQAGATLAIELGGTTPETQHDRLDVTDQATIGGTLDVELINGFDPEAGDTFDIFNFASSTGTFGDVLLPTLNTGLGWHLGELYTDGELHVELLGDLNLDGFVGVEDLDLLLANWGGSALAFDYDAGDASGDGVVGAADLAIVQANWGAGTPGSPGGGTIPEPGTAAVLALGALGLLRRQRPA